MKIFTSPNIYGSIQMDNISEYGFGSNNYLKAQKWLDDFGFDAHGHGSNIIFYKPECFKLNRFHSLIFDVSLRDLNRNPDMFTSEEYSENIHCIKYAIVSLSLPTNEIRYRFDITHNSMSNLKLHDVFIYLSDLMNVIRIFDRNRILDQILNG